jgi:hypothetical protein
MYPFYRMGHARRTGPDRPVARLAAEMGEHEKAALASGLSEVLSARAYAPEPPAGEPAGTRSSGGWSMPV